MNQVASRAKALAGNQQALLLLVLLTMIAFFTYRNPIFFSNAVFGNIMSDFSPIILIAVGQTFVIISGGIDLSVGATVAISGVTGAFAMRWLTTHIMTKPIEWQINFPGNHDLLFSFQQTSTHTLILGFLACAGTGLLVGAVNAFLITKTNVVPFIATLITMGAGSGLAIVFTGGGPIGGGPDEAIQLSVPKVGPFSYPGVAIVTLVIILGLFLHKARFGLYTFAIGSNEFAARAAGINTKRHLAKIYMLSGVLAGMAGYYYYLRLGCGAPTSGIGGELQAIAAVVIGGAALTGGQGRISGTILGALILTTVASGLIIINVAANWKQVVVAILIAAAVLLQEARTKSSSTKLFSRLLKKQN